MLDMDTPAEKVLEEFPMLAEMNKFELTMMRHDILEDTPEEDKMFLRAIDILFKRMEEGKYEAPRGDDEDDTPGEAKVLQYNR